MIGRRHITLLATAALIPAGALAAAGCGGGDSGSKNDATGAPAKTADGSAATIGVENSGLGQILDDTKGRTVYLFKKDKGTTSSCTGACASAWPPVRVTGKPVVGKGATAKVGTTSRSDGGKQITYNGHPLYTFSGDAKPGDMNGQGQTAFGGNWFAITPAGSQVKGTVSGSGSSPSGGGY
jgi:predicted lipoprotein with Yx(FWY)xxD motif